MSDACTICGSQEPVMHHERMYSFVSEKSRGSGTVTLALREIREHTFPICPSCRFWRVHFPLLALAALFATFVALGVATCAAHDRGLNTTVLDRSLFIMLPVVIALSWALAQLRAKRVFQKQIEKQRTAPFAVFTAKEMDLYKRQVRALTSD
jgi:hypothetical protein